MTRGSDFKKDVFQGAWGGFAHDAGAEATVVGGILRCGEVLQILGADLKVEDFYVVSLRRIFGAITALAERGCSVDVEAVRGELGRRGELERCGGYEGLMYLADTVATFGVVAEAARVVRENALERRREAWAVLRGSDESGERLEEAPEWFGQVNEESGSGASVESGPRCQHVSRQIVNTFRSIETAMARGVITGVPSGFRWIDSLTGGFQQGDLVVIGGRPAMGKSALATQLLVGAALITKKPVLYFSPEMTRDHLMRRMLSSEARVHVGRLRSATPAVDDWPRLLKAANVISQTQIHLEDASPTNPAEIRDRCLALKEKKGLALVVVDGVQQLQRGSGCACVRKDEELEVPRLLKSMALELNVPVIVTAQVRRRLESRVDKRPMLGDIKDSGSLERQADVVMFVYRDQVYWPETEDLGLAEIIVAKHRNGPVGMVKMRFLNEYTRFEDLVGEDKPGE